MSRISFTIPFYDGLEFLKKAVESVLRQSIGNWELWVIDDCGPGGDSAKAWIESLSDSRIRYLRNEKNLGLAMNWNRCIEVAQFDYVNILHADDQLKPNYAEVMLKASQEHPDAAAWFCRASIIDEHGRETFSVPDWYKSVLTRRNTAAFKLQGGDGLAMLMHGDFIMCPTLLYRKSKLRDLRFDPRWKMVVDLDMKIRLITLADGIVGIPNCLYEYRRHPNNQTAKLTKDLSRFHEEILIMDQTAGLAKINGWKGAARVASGKRVIKLNLGYCIVKDFFNSDVTSARSKLQLLLSVFKNS